VGAITGRNNYLVVPALSRDPIITPAHRFCERAGSDRSSQHNKNTGGWVPAFRRDEQVCQCRANQPRVARRTVPVSSAMPRTAAAKRRKRSTSGSTIPAPLTTVQLRRTAPLESRIFSRMFA